MVTGRDHIGRAYVYMFNYICVYTSVYIYVEKLEILKKLWPFFLYDRIKYHDL